MGIFMGKTHFEERLKVKAWALSCHSLSTQWKVMSWSWVWGLSITLVHVIVSAFLSDLSWAPEVLLGFPMQIYSLFLFTFWVFLKGIWFLSYALLGPQRWPCEFLFYLFMYNININGFLAIMDYISLVCWWTILPNILFKVFHWYSWVIFISDFLVQPL